ncbi:hypothetical protein AB0H83_37865 [Dactylosporangium sp. NPDC050688]|uniref:hypothetical protein n=1 Tax=Dactylosporangium sp. NPDC050688 TaxID=3157217 RepID=UPI0033D75580
MTTAFASDALSTAQRWAADRLSVAGTPVTGPGVPLGPRAWSAHLRLPTTAGSAFLKVTAPVFRHEPEVTRLLAERCPGAVPAVLAAEPGRGWLLTADYGPQPRPADRAELVAVFLAAAPVLARVQREAAPLAPALLRAGCPDHRLPVLPDRFAALVDACTSAAPPPGPDSPEPPSTGAEPPFSGAEPPSYGAEPISYGAEPISYGAEPPLTGAEVARLRGGRGQVARACAALAATGLPDTVVHLDCWRGNLVVRDDAVLIADWAESAVGHPWLSLDVLLGDVRAVEPAAEAAVADAYGAPAGTAPLTRLPALVSRALLWRSATRSLTGAARAAYAGTVTAHLRALATALEETR